MTYEEFKNQYSLRLDAQQEAAVRQTEGPVLLLAVPGSGKTTVLVARLGYMLYCRSIPPERVLTVTYTVAATRDMRARFIRFFGESDVDRLSFRTINGLCALIIRRYAWQRGAQPFELAAEEGRLKGVVRELLSRSSAAYPTDQQVKEARTHITYCKNMMLTQAQIAGHKVEGMDFPAVYTGYQDYLTRSRLMDFDDQMVFAYRILRQYPDILAYFQRRWIYLCVDEAQDTSKIQHAILGLLASKSRNLFMVGDEDQSIYGFRAAWPQALLDFERIFPGAKTLLLETNYRSCRAIVERADAFIRQNESRRPKRMRPASGQTGAIRRIRLSDYSRQAQYLLKIAERCDRSTAVLYRNHDSALPLIDLLEQRGVPYACRQRESDFFTSPLVRDLSDMLIFAFDGSDRERFLRFYYKLDLKIKKAVLLSILERTPAAVPVLQALIESGRLEPWQVGKAKSLRTHFSKIPTLSTSAALERLTLYMGYQDYLREQRGDTARLDVLLALARQTPAVRDFLPRLQALRDYIESPLPRPDSPFVLSTIHSSKGLEYDRVILIDVVDGLLPSVEAQPAGGDHLSEEDRQTLEEERRLFYVAVTRAREELDLLCYDKKFGQDAGNTASFVSQLVGSETPKAFPSAPPPRRSLLTRAAGPSKDQLALWMKDYIPGAEVTHSLFGRGVILRREKNKAVISFRETGTKKVDLPTCLRQNKMKLTFL